MLLNYITFGLNPYLKNGKNIDKFCSWKYFQYNLFMSDKKYNDAKLSAFFREKEKNKEEIPYMTIISKNTGVSNATISRYAKKKGFYNFGEMRAAYNKKLLVSFDNIETKGLEEFLMYGRINIITSKSTEIIGMFLKERLEFTNKDITIVDGDTTATWDKDTVTIMVSITGESHRIRCYLQDIKGKIIFITTEKIEGVSKNITQVVLSDYKIEIRNSYDISNAIMRMMNWLNNLANIIQIEY